MCMCTVRISSALVHPRMRSWTHVNSERYEGHGCVASPAAVGEASLPATPDSHGTWQRLGENLGPNSARTPRGLPPKSGPSASQGAPTLKSLRVQVQL